MNDDHPAQFTRADARKLADIHTALIGNRDMGTPGLVARVVTIEGKVENHDRKFWLAAIIGSGAWATVVAFKEYLFGHK